MQRKSFAKIREITRTYSWAYPERACGDNLSVITSLVPDRCSVVENFKVRDIQTNFCPGRRRSYFEIHRKTRFKSFLQNSPRDTGTERRAVVQKNETVILKLRQKRRVGGMRFLRLSRANAALCAKVAY